MLSAPNLLERHFSPRTIAELWGVSQQTVLNIFREEEGVIKITESNKKGRRPCTVIRIPESVYERVYRSRAIR